tara:strand:+ start:972 stop:1316 length:345 start_codon:yes stop_codon:yes gene_type:complete
MSQFRYWDAFIQYEDTSVSHRHMIRTIQLNRLAAGICEKCDKDVHVDILKDYMQIDGITHDMHTHRLIHILETVLTYRQMLLNCTIHRDWSICCDCQDKEPTTTTPLSEDEIPF